MPNSLDRLSNALADQYHLDRQLGEGGMATVYLAEDLKHHRRVAIKVLRPELAASLGTDRFLREIEIAARLEHPHILTLIDSGEADGFLYYVMPYMEGESLRERLDRGDQLSIDEVVRILRDVVDAVSYAHKHGVVHRDIKPDNVMLANRHASVMDFGIAKALSSATGAQHMTTEGVSLGTPAYMAPEQVAADPNVDHRADLYAVGVMAFELLTGRAPFLAETPQQVLAAHVTVKPEPVTVHRRDTPPGLADMVMACLGKRPEERPAGADDILRVLEASAVNTSGAATSITARGPRMGTLIFWMMAATVTIAGVFAWIRTGGPAVMPDPAVVAVVPFRVSGADRSLEYLREGMLDLLAVKLTGAGGLRVADPRSTIAAWRQRGGSEADDLPLESALVVAEQLGAGRLLLGSVVGTPEQTVLTATLITISDGHVVAEASVNGPVDSLPYLVDRLAEEVLVQGAGASGERLAALTSSSLPALQSYLEGLSAYRNGQYEEAPVHFERALAFDANFAMAAFGHFLAVMWVGSVEELTRALEVSWQFRVQLPPRERALLIAMAGPDYPEGSPLSYLSHGWDDALAEAPDWAIPWYITGDQVFHFGSVANIADWANRSAAYFDRAIDLDSSFQAPLGHRLELSALVGDVALTRRLHRRLQELSPESDLTEFYTWRTATVGDDEDAIGALRGNTSSVSSASLMRIMATSQLDGVGVDDVDLWAAEFRKRVAVGDAGARSDAWLFSHAAALNQGRPTEARDYLPSATAPGCRFCSDLSYSPRFSDQPEQRARWASILDALFWNGDSAMAAVAADQLARPDGAIHWGDVCMLGLWRVAHGETGHTSEAVGALRQVTETTNEWTVRALADLCGAIIEAQHAAFLEDGIDGSIARLDSVWRNSPRYSSAVWDNGAVMNMIANLVLARLKASQGDLDGARQAIGRRSYHWLHSGLLLSTALREEGRLAVLDGDRDAAVEAYQHYLALRHDPEPRLQPQADSVQAELAELLGEQVGP